MNSRNTKIPAMKKLSLYVVIMLFTIVLTSCSTSTTESGINTDNLSLGTKFMDAIHDKDTAKLDRIFADDFIGYGSGTGDSMNKAEAIAKWKTLFDTYESIEVLQSSSAAAKTNEGPNAGDYVTTWAGVKITYKNGKGPVTLAVNYIFRVKDGKINLSRAFFNEADTMRQLGYQFIPPAAK
jgi:limonene-1,2-epoxide hydrolase